MVPAQFTNLLKQHGLLLSYFWHRKADCLGVTGDRQRNNKINNFAGSISKWVRRLSLAATLTKPRHSSPA
jgi:hypothetical protein